MSEDFVWETSHCIFQLQRSLCGYLLIWLPYNLHLPYFKVSDFGRESGVCGRILMAFANKFDVERFSSNVFYFQYLSWSWSLFQSLLYSHSPSLDSRATSLTPCLVWGTYSLGIEIADLTSAWPQCVLLCISHSQQTNGKSPSMYGFSWLWIIRMSASCTDPSGRGAASIYWYGLFC